MKPFPARFFTAMSYPAPERCFRNRLPDSRRSHQPSDSAAAPPISGHALLLLQSPPAILSDNFLSAALHLKDEVVQATWSNSSATPRKNLSIYTGTLGTAFLCFRAYQATGNLQDLHLCRDIIQACSAASASMRQCPTFLLGVPGIFALGAAAAKCFGNKQEVDRYVKLLGEIGKESALVVSSDRNGTPYELLYGRAGYLWATLFVNKQLGYEAISANIVRPILDSIIAGGRAKGSETSCPLMYQWHGKAYWGAAHGLAGIMHCLLHFQLKEEDTEAVKCVLKYMIENRFPESKNYPSRKGNKEDKLVQWCHGAPGLALTLCKAAEVFPEEPDFKKAAVEAAEVVWERGLLRKVGICHGISGNAYTFLALYRLLGEDVYLHRAKAFGCFLLDCARNLIASGDMHGGDHPYSLFEGLAGMSFLWLDLVNPESAKFPGYEV